MEKYSVSGAVGEGAYARVFRATRKADGEPVAIKKLKGEFTSWDEVKNFAEVRAFKKVKHANVIGVKEVFKQDTSVYMVFEYCPSDLFQQMQFRKKMGRSFSDVEIRTIAHQLLQGISFVHGQSLVHRDIKPENVLISHKNGQMKLGDFGQACELNRRAQMTDYVGTRWYRAPEMLLGGHYDHLADMWSIGCLIAELHLLRPLFAGSSEADQMNKICSVTGAPGPNNFPQGSDLLVVRGVELRGLANVDLDDLIPSASPMAMDLMRNLLRLDPKQRFTAQKALKSNYFKEQILDRMEWANVSPQVDPSATPIEIHRPSPAPSPAPSPDPAKLGKSPFFDDDAGEGNHLSPASNFSGLADDRAVNMRRPSVKDLRDLLKESPRGGTPIFLQGDEENKHVTDTSDVLGGLGGAGGGKAGIGRRGQRGSKDGPGMESGGIRSLVGGDSDVNGRRMKLSALSNDDDEFGFENETSGYVPSTKDKGNGKRKSLSNMSNLSPSPDFSQSLSPAPGNPLADIGVTLNGNKRGSRRAGSDAMDTAVSMPELSASPLKNGSSGGQGRSRSQASNQPNMSVIMGNSEFEDDDDTFDFGGGYLPSALEKSGIRGPAKGRPRASSTEPMGDQVSEESTGGQYKAKAGRRGTRPGGGMAGLAGLNDF